MYDVDGKNVLLKKSPDPVEVPAAIAKALIARGMATSAELDKEPDSKPEPIQKPEPIRSFETKKRPSFVHKDKAFDDD